jgi:hypothetical protein
MRRARYRTEPSLALLGACAVLARLAVAGAPGSVSFTDPAEGAFSVTVPAGWKVSGGLYRFGPLDPRVMVEIDSPDGQVRLRLGDAGVGPYAVPDRTLIATGFREGARYSPNGVAQEVVANYRPGWVFADLYGQARFTTACRTLELKHLARVPPVHQDPGADNTAGEALYGCNGAAGGRAIAYVFAETQLTHMQSSAIWQVTWLYSFIAPEPQLQLAVRTLLHTLRSFQLSPQWESYQLRLNGAAGEAAYRAYQQAVAQEHARFERQEAQFQQQVDDFSRELRGVTLTTDPVDHTVREVWSGPHAGYFINPVGTVVNADSSPGGDYRRQQTR